jgi:hypothetical protein
MSHTSKIPPAKYATSDLPTDLEVGSLVFDSDTSEHKVFNGSSWDVVSGESFGTATIVSSNASTYDQIQGDIPANWKNSDSYLKGLVIGTSCTNIGSDAFYFCTNLKNSLVIPDSVTTIGSFAFYAGTGLTSLTIGSNVTSIGNSTFGNCSSITSISILATTAPTIDNNSFFGLTSLSPAVIHVPSGATGYDASYGGYTVVYDL